jgi:hypothetical protein
VKEHAEYRTPGQLPVIIFSMKWLEYYLSFETNELAI